MNTTLRTWVTTVVLGVSVLGTTSAVSAQAITDESVVHSRVTRHSLAANGQRVGLLLENGTEIAPAPWHRDALLSVASPGDPVSVRVRPDSTIDVRNERTGARVNVGGPGESPQPVARGGGPVAPSEAAPGNSLTWSDRVAVVVQDARGRATSLLTERGVQLRVPEQVQGVLGSVRQGEYIHVQARRVPGGNADVLSAITITRHDGRVVLDLTRGR